LPAGTKLGLINKLDEKDSTYIEMMAKVSNGWKYKKLEDGEGRDSSDSTTTE